MRRILVLLVSCVVAPMLMFSAVMVASDSIQKNLPGAPDEGRQLSDAEKRAEKRWLAAVERYRDESLPSVVRGLFDVQVENGAHADRCAEALRRLPTLAQPFVKAPSPELSNTAGQVHRATEKQLRACVDRQPKLFNTAESRRAKVAAELTAVYREWLGVDVKGYANPRAW